MESPLIIHVKNVEDEQDGEITVTITRYAESGDYFKIYELEVTIYPVIALIPQFWVYSRILRPRTNWAFILTFYVIFILIWSILDGIFGSYPVSTPSIYTLSGTGCSNSQYASGSNSSFMYSTNGNFTYYVQGFIGLCLTPTQQDYGSPNCILWTDDTFWKNFQNSISNDYENEYDCSNCHGQAVEDAHSLSLQPSYKLLYFAGVMVSVSRPLQSCFSYFTRNHKLPYLKNYFCSLVVAIAIFIFYFFLFFMDIDLGLIGSEDVNACIQPANWKAFYNCENVIREKNSILEKINFATWSALVQLFFSFPEIVYCLYAFMRSICPGCTTCCFDCLRNLYINS